MRQTFYVTQIVSMAWALAGDAEKATPVSGTGILFGAVAVGLGGLGVTLWRRWVAPAPPASNVLPAFKVRSLGAWASRNATGCHVTLSVAFEARLSGPLVAGIGEGGA